MLAFLKSKNTNLKYSFYKEKAAFYGHKKI